MFVMSAGEARSSSAAYDCRRSRQFTCADLHRETDKHCIVIPCIALDCHQFCCQPTSSIPQHSVCSSTYQMFSYWVCGHILAHHLALGVEIHWASTNCVLT